MIIMIQPRLFDGTNDEVKTYVEKIKKVDETKEEWLKKPVDKINDEYEKLQKSGRIKCNDGAEIETKIDRILTINEFPENNFVYRPVKLTKNILDVLESDWKYSNENNREVFRMLCIDEATNDVLLTNDSTRIEGSGTSVKPEYDLCEKSFPKKSVIPIGGVHTHPEFLDKPLESLGDVLVFSTAGNEMFSCTTTGWGTMCMFRKKEPVKVFDIPRTKKDKDGKPVPVLDENGRIIYDVKSDMVDWNRTLRFANRGLTQGVFVASKGIVNEKITSLLSRVAWFPPDKEDPSTGTTEAPFEFGKEKAEPQEVNNLYCESFVDVYGVSTKVRTVCIDGEDEDTKPFYVETGLLPAKLFFFPNNGFPTNVWVTDDVEVKTTHPIEKTDSRFWDHVEKDHKGYFKTKSEETEDFVGGTLEKKTVRASRLEINGNNWCEYLLLPLPAGKEEKDIGKPAALMCRKKPLVATEETCVLT